MLVALDVKFTNLASPSLISIALVAENGSEFYAESDEYPSEDSSDFVISCVLPLLGKTEGALCSLDQLAIRLREWFDLLPEPAVLIFNSSCSWRLLIELLRREEPLSLPQMLGSKQFIPSVLEVDPLFSRTMAAAYSSSLSHFHALADAKAFLAGYKAWLASCAGCS